MSRAPRAAAKPAVRRAPRAAAAAPRRRTSSIGQQVGRAFGGIPIPRDLLRRIGNWSLGLFIAAGIVAGIIAMGVPQMIGLEIAHGLGRMGFVVRNIEISGRSHVDRDTVYRIVSDQRGQDMALVDIGETRRLLIGPPGQPSWIADARVSRRLPDTLVVDLVERTPAAILQRNRQLYLVDIAGRQLSGVDARTLPLQLPLVIGVNVERHIPDLQTLVGTQPTLKQLIAGATWVGDRRWDIRFQSGETLALPEGVAEARTAYATFARKDQEERLLGRGFVRFDMRNPNQMVVRTTTDPGAKIEDPAPPVPASVA
jgi:cell division protein FtsQ